MCLGLPGAAHAGTINVDTTHDELNGDGDCSLREAVQAANANTAVSGCAAGDAGADTITLPEGQFALIGASRENSNVIGDLDIYESLTLDGDGGTIDADRSDRSLDIRDGADPVHVTVQGLNLIRGNSGRQDGGAIRVDQADSQLTLLDTRLANNRSGGNGGAVYSEGDVTATEGGWLGNEATGSGGALESHGTLTVGSADDGFRILDNLAGGSGGGISSFGPASISVDFINGNSARDDGGAISNKGGDPLEIILVEFQDNGNVEGFPRPERGGAVFSNGNLSVAGSAFSDGRADVGGAIAVAEGTSASLSTNVFPSEFDDNSADFGGALDVPGELSATGARFSFNRASNSGGAINSTPDTPANVELTDTLLHGNTARGSGGAAINVLGSDLVLSRVAVTDNRSSGGAPVAVDNDFEVGPTLQDDVAIENSLFAGNLGGTVSKIYSAGTFTIDYSTIANNKGPGLIGGSIGHSILAFNTNHGKAENCYEPRQPASSGHNIESQDTCGFSAGAPTFDRPNTNPLLAQRSTPLDTFNQVMRLYPASPALDAVPGGDCPPPATDQRGASRPQGTSCDIGSFEGTVPGPKAECHGRKVTIQGTRSTDPFTGERTRSNDVLIGTPNRDVIAGGKGNDLLKGGRGRDVICGGPGRDTLRGGPGDDILRGGPGRDRLRGGPGHDSITP